MRINTKDLISGGLIVLFAAVGLWLNLDHTLGSARRMGPGYMPMLTFWLLGGLGVLVLIAAFTSGPNPLERWTKLDVTTAILGTVVGLVVYGGLEYLGYGEGNWRHVGFGFLAGLLVLSISPSWRPLGLVHAAMAIFALGLEPLGLVVTLVLTIVVASLADREHTPLGVLGMVVFLVALAWAVFIWQLDIRIPLWPTIL